MRSKVDLEQILQEQKEYYGSDTEQYTFWLQQRFREQSLPGESYDESFDRVREQFDVIYPQWRER